MKGGRKSLHRRPPLERATIRALRYASWTVRLPTRLPRLQTRPGKCAPILPRCSIARKAWPIDADTALSIVRGRPLPKIASLTHGVDAERKRLPFFAVT